MDLIKEISPNWLQLYRNGGEFLYEGWRFDVCPGFRNHYRYLRYWDEQRKIWIIFDEDVINPHFLITQIKGFIEWKKKQAAKVSSPSSE